MCVCVCVVSGVNQWCGVFHPKAAVFDLQGGDCAQLQVTPLRALISVRTDSEPLPVVCVCVCVCVCVIARGEQATGS